MRKRIIPLLLALVMALSLCACGGGNQAKVDSALQGLWSIPAYKGISVGYAFGVDNSFMIMAVYNGESLGEEYGTYEIGDDEITVTKENGDEIVFAYTYESGTLTIYSPNGDQMTKVDVSD